MFFQSKLNCSLNRFGAEPKCARESHPICIRNVPLFRDFEITKSKTAKRARERQRWKCVHISYYRLRVTDQTNG